MDINRESQTYNFLRPHSIRMVIHDTPEVAFLTQNANLPSINGMGGAVTENPFVAIPNPYDKLAFGNLQVEFIVSEDLSNYMQIVDWMTAIGFPNDRVVDYNKKVPEMRITRKNNQDYLISDLSLIIMDSDNHQMAKVTYLDAFPTVLSDIKMDVRQQGFQYVTATTEFVFRTFNVSIGG